MSENVPNPRIQFYIGVIDLESFIDLNRIREHANRQLGELAQRVNLNDLGHWRLTVKLVFRGLDDVRIGKRLVTYPSDHEKEWSIIIPVPRRSQAPYGLPDKHFVSDGYAPSDALFHRLDASFASHADLQACLEGNAARALDAAFVQGVTVAGKRIKLTPGNTYAGG